MQLSSPLHELAILRPKSKSSKLSLLLRALTLSLSPLLLRAKRDPCSPPQATPEAQRMFMRSWSLPGGPKQLPIRTIRNLYSFTHLPLTVPTRHCLLLDWGVKRHFFLLCYWLCQPPKELADAGWGEAPQPRTGSLSSWAPARFGILRIRFAQYECRISLRTNQ